MEARFQIPEGTFGTFGSHDDSTFLLFVFQIPEGTFGTVLGTRTTSSG